MGPRDYRPVAAGDMRVSGSQVSADKSTDDPAPVPGRSSGDTILNSSLARSARACASPASGPAPHRPSGNWRSGPGTGSRAAGGDLGEIGNAIVVGEEDRQPPIAALRDMMRDLGNNDAGEMSHGGRSSQGRCGEKLRIVSPELVRRAIKYCVPGIGASDLGLFQQTETENEHIARSARE